MEGVMNVEFTSGRVHQMSVDDVVLLTRYWEPFHLPCLQSKTHFKRFQHFVRRQQEDELKRQQEQQAEDPAQVMPQWQREFLDEITDRSTLDAWMDLALTTNQQQLERILNIRNDELEEEDSEDEEEEDEDSEEEGDGGGAGSGNGDAGGRADGNSDNHN